MNRKSLILLLVLIFAAIWACSSPSSDSEKKVELTKAEKTAPVVEPLPKDADITEEMLMNQVNKLTVEVERMQVQLDIAEEERTRMENELVTTKTALTQSEEARVKAVQDYEDLRSMTIASGILNAVLIIFIALVRVFRKKDRNGDKPEKPLKKETAPAPAQPEKAKTPAPAVVEPAKPAEKPVEKKAEKKPRAQEETPADTAKPKRGRPPKKAAESKTEPEQTPANESPEASKE